MFLSYQMVIKIHCLEFDPKTLFWVIITSKFSAGVLSKIPILREKRTSTSSGILASSKTTLRSESPDILCYICWTLSHSSAIQEVPLKKAIFGVNVIIRTKHSL